MKILVILSLFVSGVIFAQIGFIGEESLTPVVGGGASDEFDIVGAEYYAVAPGGYSYTAGQTTEYTSGRKYTSLTGSGGAIEDLDITPGAVLVINIIGDGWGEEDMTATETFPNVDTSTYKLVIRTVLNDANGENARHSGLISDGHRMKMANSNSHMFEITGSNTSEVEMIGLSWEVTYTGGSVRCLEIGDISEVTVNNSMLVGSGNGSQSHGVRVNNSGNTFNMRNNMILTWKDGINDSSGGGTFWVCHNNTWGGNDYHIAIDDTDNDRAIFIGNLFAQAGTQDSTRAYADLDSSSDYNVSDDSAIWTSGSSTNEVVNATAVFADLGSLDLHLAAGDDARGNGADLSGTFTDDIDGETRSAWDAGADEF